MIKNHINGYQSEFIIYELQNIDFTNVKLI